MPIQPYANHPPKREAFARRLRVLLNNPAVNPEGFIRLGADLANLRNPPRAIPYGDYTLDGWTNGELLPTPKAFAAIEAVCKERLGTLEMTSSQRDGALRTLRAAYEDALKEQYPDDPQQARATYKPTEVTHALRTATRGKNLFAIQQQVERATEQWVRSERAKGHEVAAIASHVPTTHEIEDYLLGNTIRTPNRFLLQVIAAQATALNPPIHAVLEQRLREVASELWDEAIAQNNPGKLIYACRVRLGDTRPQFLDRFRDVLGQQATAQDHAALKQQVMAWEQAGWGQTRTASLAPALCGMLVEIMQAADAQSNTIDSISIDQPWNNTHRFSPWFDKEKAALMNVIFKGTKPEASLRPATQGIAPLTLAYKGTLNASTAHARVLGG